MQSYKVVRWFTNTENKKITNWFANKNCKFSLSNSKTDYYKKLGHENLSIKLSGITIEVNERCGKNMKKQLSKNTTGIIEKWCKWKFSIRLEDLEFKNITNDEDIQWTKILKAKVGLKIAKDQNGKLVFLPLSEHISHGCLLEYTRLQIKDSVWYSLSVKWIGEKCFEIDENLINEITGNSILGCMESFSYNEFLNRL